MTPETALGAVPRLPGTAGEGRAVHAKASENAGREVSIDSTAPSSFSALLVAASLGNGEVVRALLQRGVEVNATDQDGHTPLFLAARGGHLHVFRLLVDAAAATTTRDRLQGFTPLHVAARRGHNNVVVALLLEEGVNADDEDDEGLTPLSWAVVGGHVSVVDSLLSAGAEISRRPLGTDPLFHVAVSLCGDTAATRRRGVVASLLKGGADLRTVDAKGRTALHVAAERGHTEVTNMLLDAGADLRSVNLEGRIPLHGAVSFGHVATTRILLGAGSNIESRIPEHNFTPLHMAATQPDLDMVSTLVGLGADTEALVCGETALCIAAALDRAEIVKFLLGSGAVVDAFEPEYGGASPLSRAAARGNVRTLRLLLARGADVASTDEDGWTPLHWVCRFRPEKAVETVDLLLRFGADENVQSSDGDTPGDLLLNSDSDSGSGSGSDSEDEEDPHGFAPPQCSADEVNAVRALLDSAENDRVWRRRSLFVLLRARASASEAADGDTATDDEDGRERKAARTEAVEGGTRGGQGGAGNGVGVGGGGSYGVVTSWLVGKACEGIFRTVVGFL